MDKLSIYPFGAIKGPGSQHLSFGKHALLCIRQLVKMALLTQLGINDNKCPVIWCNFISYGVLKRE